MLKNATSFASVSAATRGRRRLDHHSERKLVTVFDSARIELGRRLVEEVARLPHFVERDDERKHDADVAVHRRAQQRAKLRLEQLGLVEAHPDRAPAEERIRIGRIAADRKLVASDVEGANHDRVMSPNAVTTFLYARYCSSSSGIVARPTTRNSVRMSPTPSAPQ